VTGVLPLDGGPPQVSPTGVLNLPLLRPSPPAGSVRLVGGVTGATGSTRSSAVAQTLLPGAPPSSIDTSLLKDLLALVEPPSDLDVGPGGWDISWWIGVVLFEGWEGWWDRAEAAAPQTTRRLRALLRPAWRHRLTTTRFRAAWPERTRSTIPAMSAHGC
jgi:hypothetical protein